MITITFISHKTTDDNENKIASGWNNVPLSELGKEQALETKAFFKDKKFDYIFCSDLERSLDTALVVFKDHSIPVIIDWRIRECNYGDMNGCAKREMESLRESAIEIAYPKGESYTECVKRMKEFLDWMRGKFDGSTVCIVGHRATQYTLESLCLKKALKEIVTAPWSWQEKGWEYILE